MFYLVALRNWKNKFSKYSTFTLKIYWTFYSFYWSFGSILLCKINHFTEHILLANLFLKYWSFYPKYLAFNIVSLRNFFACWNDFFVSDALILLLTATWINGGKTESENRHDESIETKFTSKINFNFFLV